MSAGFAAAQTHFRHLTYEEAVEAAKTEGKQLFIDFYTDWCGPCKMMEREVFPQKEVGDYLNSRFVCIKLNAEKEGKEKAGLWEVKAYPTFVIVDTLQNVVAKKEGGATPEKFVAAISRAIDPERAPERLVARYEAGERTPRLIEDYADMKLEEGNHSDEALQEVSKIIGDYFEGLPDAERLSRQNLFVYTQYAENPADPAVQYMVAHRNEFPAELQDTIKACITRIYKQEMFNYLCALVPYEKASYEAAKQVVNALGMNDTHYYDPLFRLVECHAKGDMDAFLDLCEEEYPRLDADQRFYLMAGFARLVGTGSSDIRRRAAKMVRSKLENMEIRLLFFIPSVLSELEREYAVSWRRLPHTRESRAVREGGGCPT